MATRRATWELRGVFLAGTVLVVTTGCGAAAPDDQASALGLAAAAAATSVTSVTLSGTEQFDDYRDYGRFAIRKDASGNNGKQHSMDGLTTNANYLALMDATVEVYEVDNDFDPTDATCARSTLAATTTVRADGRWSVTIPSVSDPCASDDEGRGQVSLAVKVVLRFCDDVRCFSVVDPRTGTSNADMTPWHLFRSDASLARPWVVSSGQTVALGTHYFEDTASPIHDVDERNDAAMIFAGLVDVTRKFHVQGSWDFHVADHGEVFLQFPSADKNGNTHGPSTIEMIAGQLKDGWTPLHEYGHILSNRVTSFASRSGGGDYDLFPCGVNEVTGKDLTTAADCDVWNRSGEFEHSSKSWEEGFADFVAHMTLDGQGSTEAPAELRIGCSSDQYDPNVSAATALSGGNAEGFGQRVIFGCGTVPGTCVDGRQYPTNVARALCDWYDDSSPADDDTERAGAGDKVSHSLAEIETTMVGAYTALGATNLAADGFSVCDFFTYFINDQGGDLKTHLDAIMNNGFSCGF